MIRCVRFLFSALALDEGGHRAVAALEVMGDVNGAKP
jgi:hypothetical protein